MLTRAHIRSVLLVFFVLTYAVLTYAAAAEKTNDSSTVPTYRSIVSPKLVECARNLNIEIMTLSELINLEGQPGHFKATVKRHPRYVIEDKCNGCSECTQVCPVDIPDEFNRCLGTRKGIEI